MWNEGNEVAVMVNVAGEKAHFMCAFIPKETIDQ